MSVLLIIYCFPVLETYRNFPASAMLDVTVRHEAELNK